MLAALPNAAKVIFLTFLKKTPIQPHEFNFCEFSYKFTELLLVYLVFEPYSTLLFVDMVSSFLV